MNKLPYEIPVALFIFNRPELTRRVIERLRGVRPSQLLVVADGPRASHAEDAKLCNVTRSVIHDVDWACRILTDYADTNLGCRQRVSSGLDWVFENVEEAVILEDDCLPHVSFFSFAAELLRKYRSQKQIMSITGDNFQIPHTHSEDSYYFSRYAHVWGWATWRRAWRPHYDVDIKAWPRFRDSQTLAEFFPNPSTRRYWRRIMQRVYDGELDTWDLQWTFAGWQQAAFTVIPSVNLVTNIGFGNWATHTTDSRSPFANLPSYEMNFPLKHPTQIVRNLQADEYIEQTQFRVAPLWRRISDRIQQVLR